MSTANPWVSRLSNLLDRQTLKKSMELTPIPIDSPWEMELSDLCKEFEVKCDNSFYPTEQSIDIALRIIGEAASHAKRTYPGPNEFIRLVYEPVENDESAVITKFHCPIVLTGLAGLGKSSLLLAIRRSIPEVSVKVANSHPNFKLSSAKYFEVGDRAVLNKVLVDVFKVKKTRTNFIQLVKESIYTKSIPLLLVDEFQFSATSSDANTMSSKLLLGLGLLNIPYVCSLNFSLFHKLLKRPQEERDRALANVIVMIPEDPKSKCWQLTIGKLLEIIPTMFRLDINNDSERLFQMTAGRNRALVKLLMEGVRVAAKSQSLVTMSTLEKVYLSKEYATLRQDTELIYQQAILGKPMRGRSDLYCPAEYVDESNRQKNEAIEYRNQQAAQVELLSTLSVRERQNLVSFQKDLSLNLSADMDAPKKKKEKKALTKSLEESTRDFLSQL